MIPAFGQQAKKNNIQIRGMVGTIDIGLFGIKLLFELEIEVNTCQQGTDQCMECS